MRFIIFLFSLLFFFLSPYPVSAHLEGQPPYFKINGVFSDLYSVQWYSATPDTDPPQDIAKNILVVNEPVLFELDYENLSKVIAPEIIEKTKFNWELGDGVKTTGMSHEHIYRKPGPYILSIYADTSAFERGTSPQLLQSVLFYILPDRNYKIPIPNIKVNGQGAAKDTTTNVLQNVFDIDFEKEVVFDGSTSTKGTAAIAKYVWDFGDGKTQEGEKVMHTYVNPLPYMTPVLRVVDANGFYAESSIGIKKPGATMLESTNVSNQETTASSLGKKIAMGIAACLILFGIVQFALSKKASSKKK